MSDDDPSLHVSTSVVPQTPEPEPGPERASPPSPKQDRQEELPPKAKPARRKWWQFWH
jgi:hypothetical protein